METQVVIVADPGTVLCEGDPALLTVVLGTSTPLGTLYTQGTNPAANGSPSQVFEPANATLLRSLQMTYCICRSKLVNYTGNCRWY